MATARNPIRVLIEAKQIAHDHGCFVVEKPQKNGTRYLVYRRAACGNIYQGFRGSPDALRRFICKITKFH